MELLKQFFEEGHDSLFDDYNIEWVHTNPEVDTILGFIEQYRDTRGAKGSFESMVFFKDHKMNHIIKTIAENSQYFEDNSPWIQDYKKKWGKIPVANAIMLLGGCGDAGPICWAGVNLPNAQSIREKHGSKNIYVSNVTYASRTAFSKEAFAEFIEKKEDADMIRNASNVRGPILVTLHEVVGHGSGQMSKNLKGDPRDHLREFYSSLEEARAELCSLHHVWDPKLMELGLVESEEQAKGAYLGYVFQYLAIHRRFAGEEHIHEDHERATALIVEYCRDKGSAGFYKKNGKTYPEVKDYQLMRKHVAELLSEIMRIKAEGDYEAGKNLVTKYGININSELRDEIVSRAQQIGYPSRFAYIMPHPELVHDSSGKVIDVKLEWYNSLLEQGKAWRKLSEQR